ncbi:DUF3137 domain-containing protein [bacterium]|nr:DUF3137 domain-containing protein [bacterium]
MNNKKEIYYKYFEEKLLPFMYPLEEYRLNTVKKLIISSVLMFLAGILSAFLFIHFCLKNTSTLLLLPVFLFLMYFFFIKSIINVMWTGRQYQKWLTEKVLPYFFEPVANFKHWFKNNDIKSLLDAGIFGNFDAQEDVECIFGVYNNTNIIVSNTSLTIPVNRTVFKGTVIQLELTESIENHVVLISKNERKHNRYRQYNPHIEELNKYLYVFAKNQNNIDFINEDFWKIIERFGYLYTAKGLSISYKNNIFIIAMRQKFPWQFGFIFKSLLKAKNYDDLIERFTVIFDLVDLLTKQPY